jgi:DegV family protein with EDD domain
MLRLFTDTDTDITPAVAGEYGYRLISMPYSIDAKTVFPYEDFEVFESHAFYDLLRSGVLPTTSAISKERYLAYFEPEFAAGNDILYVHFSRAMTITFDAMDQAVAELKARYPERRFEEIDTKGITTVSYAVVRAVGDLFRAGKTLDEVLEWARTEVDRYAMYFFADDLKFFRRSGRVSGLAATMGTLIGIRPIIYMSQEGKMVSCGKEKGRPKAMERLITQVEELGDEIKAHRFYVGHTDAPELAQELGRMLKARFGDDLDIEYVVCNPTAGSHSGPNGVGVCFHAKHR